MVKTKTSYACTECGASASKWSGKCGDCGAWNSFTEVVLEASSNPRFKNYSGESASTIIPMNSVAVVDETRISSGLKELDRVLGGGIVPGAVVLIGGDPGIGKSTVLLQAFAQLSQTGQALYVTGEESLQQVKLRAKRLGFIDLDLPLLSETNVETILELAKIHKPKFVVIDSIQTIFTHIVQSAPGSVSQVREATAQIVQFAKQTDTSVFLVGHVTKEGNIAGPRVLEHMVDSVLYFEGQTDGKYRMLRAVKNRFGAVNELGIFSMTDKGLREVSNPSAIFLSRRNEDVCGSVVLVTWEGSRPMLVEIQALVDESHLGNPRRVAVGFDHNRLALILAVLHRHGGIFTYNQDVYINVVGGVKVSETGIDLAVLLAVVSSLKNKPISNSMVVFGEVGLSGEVRPVQCGQERLKEASKLGFKKAIVAAGNAPKDKICDLEVLNFKTLSKVLDYVFSS